MNANDIIEFFNDLKGFDEWWHDIDPDVKKEIKRDLNNLLKSKKKAGE